MSILIFETGVHGKERQLAIDRFSDVDSNSFLFLLSTRAGGVGINLTAADRVIIFDSDWNPQNDVQAMARCHRIGQKKQVSVFRLITAKTYEAQMFERASMKLGLDQAVLHGMTSKVSKNALVGASKDEDYQPTKEELNEILKYGAYDLFREEREGTSDANSKKFSEEDIDSILNRAVHIAQESKTTNGLSSKFSVATFASANADSSVDVEDPDFWTKTVGLSAMAASQKKKPSLMIGGLSPLKTRKGKYNNKNYSEVSLANGQWEDDEYQPDQADMPARFTKQGVFNCLKTLWNSGWTRSAELAVTAYPDSRLKDKKPQEIQALLKAFVSMIAIAHVSTVKEAAKTTHGARVVSSKWLAPGWTSVLVKDRFGKNANKEREVYQAPDGTQYEKEEEAKVKELMKNQSGPAISALQTLASKFVICKTILEEQKQGADEDNYTPHGYNDIDMHMDCLNHQDLLRKNLKEGMTSKWLNHLDDCLIMTQYADEAKDLLVQLKANPELSIVAEDVLKVTRADVKFSSSSSSSSSTSSFTNLNMECRDLKCQRSRAGAASYRCSTCKNRVTSTAAPTAPTAPTPVVSAAVSAAAIVPTPAVVAAVVAPTPVVVAPKPATASSSANKTKGTRKTRCNKCDGCLAEDCGTCRYCLDKPKRGGSNTLRKPCELRTCTNPTIKGVSASKAPTAPTASSTATASSSTSATTSNKVVKVVAKVEPKVQPTTVIDILKTLSNKSHPIKSDKYTWSLSDDVSLLIGSYQYGNFPKVYSPKVYEDMLKDENLSFYSPLQDVFKEATTEFESRPKAEQIPEKSPIKKLKFRLKRRWEVICNQLRHFTQEYAVSNDTAYDFDRRFTRTKKEKVKRARSAFNIFRGDVFSIIKDEFPDYTLGEVAKETSVRFRAMSVAERAKYDEKAAQELILYPPVARVKTAAALEKERIKAEEKAFKKQQREAGWEAGRLEKAEKAETRRAEWKSEQEKRKASRRTKWTTPETHALFLAAQDFGIPKTEEEQIQIVLDSILLQVSMPVKEPLGEGGVTDSDFAMALAISEGQTVPQQKTIEDTFTFEQNMYRKHSGATYFISSPEMLLNSTGDTLKYKTVATVAQQAIHIGKETLFWATQLTLHERKKLTAAKAAAEAEAAAAAAATAAASGDVIVIDAPNAVGGSSGTATPTSTENVGATSSSSSSSSSTSTKNPFSKSKPKDSLFGAVYPEGVLPVLGEKKCRAMVVRTREWESFETKVMKRSMEDINK